MSERPVRLPLWLVAVSATTVLASTVSLVAATASLVAAGRISRLNRPITVAATLPLAPTAAIVPSPSPSPTPQPGPAYTPAPQIVTHYVPAAPIATVRPSSTRAALRAVPRIPPKPTPTPSTVPTASALRLGYFANVTHAVGLVGVSQGFFQNYLGHTQLQTQVFDAGPSAIEALNAGSIDAAFVGPNPAITDFVQSHGDALRIVSGASSGGAELVVSSAIKFASDLKGKTLATPQLGNTQDVALKYWLTQQGFNENATNGSGDVTVVNQDNATTLQAFQQGQIAGAWLPEPWASRLVLQGSGHVLVDERSLWAGGKFTSTDLIVSRAFLAKYPATVQALLQGEVYTASWINTYYTDAQRIVNADIQALTGKSLPDNVISRAFSELQITVDPLASTLAADAQHSDQIGLTSSTNLNGIYDLRLLNQILTADGQAPVSSDGLGPQ